MINQITQAQPQVKAEPAKPCVSKTFYQQVLDFVKNPFCRDHIDRTHAPKGIAMASINLAADKIMNLPGFNEGDKVEVDGPVWYNGDGKVDKFNEKVLDFNMRMKVPGDFDTYKVKDGKINISIKVEKQDDGSVMVTTTDHNDNDKAIAEKGNIIAGTNKYTIKGDTQTVTLAIRGSGKLTLTSDQMGDYSIDINKK